jgi:hypothetical protein
VKAQGDEPGVEGEADGVARLQKANRTATELCGAGKFQEAEKLLIGAIQDAVNADLGDNPALVSAHGILGLIYSRGIKDDRRAVEHFKQALRLKPDLKLNKSSSTPEADKNFSRAWAEIQAGDDDAPPAAPPSAPAADDEPVATVGSDGLTCPASAEIQVGDDVTLRCLTTGITPAKVVLSFKPAGQDSFQSLPMTSTPSADGSRMTWTARIPGSATVGQVVPYFFEARDKKGTLIAQAGAEDNPNLITIKGGDQTEPDTAGATEPIDDNDPLARHREARRRERDGSKGTAWFSLGVGTGFGRAKGGETEAFGKSDRITSKAGLAWASLGQLVPEIGYFLDNNWALSITGRLQYVPTGQSLPNSDHNEKVASQVAKGALSALLRLMYFGEEDGGWRFYGAAAVGGGEGFRYRVTVQSTIGDIKDTQRGGPLVGGLAGGALCRLNKSWHWVFETGLLVGFPDTSAVLDVSTGIRAEF